MKIPHQQRCLLCPYQLAWHELLDYYFPVSQITLPFKLLFGWKTNEPNFIVLYFQSSMSLPTQQYFLHVCYKQFSRTICHDINLFIFTILWVKSPLFLFTLLQLLEIIHMSMYKQFSNLVKGILRQKHINCKVNNCLHIYWQKR